MEDQYILIVESDSDVFIKVINDKLKNGWTLHGHTSCIEHNSKMILSQALIKQPSRHAATAYSTFPPYTNADFGWTIPNNKPSN